MREVCCSIVSAVVFKILFVFFVFEFGVVGATLGAIVGAVIGWNNNRRFKEGIIIGIASETTLSFKLIKAIFDYLHYDDHDELVFLKHLVTLIAEDPVKVLRGDQYKIAGFNKAPFAKFIHW